MLSLRYAISCPRMQHMQVGDEGMSLEDLAYQVQVEPSDLVRTLFMKGIMLSMNQVWTPGGHGGRCAVWLAAHLAVAPDTVLRVEELQAGCLQATVEALSFKRTRAGCFAGLAVLDINQTVFLYLLSKL